ncbi:MAG: hypothetical protein ACP5N1_06635 [Candidatus Woesearchaeota archaeon]
MPENNPLDDVRSERLEVDKINNIVAKLLEKKLVEDVTSDIYFFFKNISKQLAYLEALFSEMMVDPTKRVYNRNLIIKQLLFTREGLEQIHNHLKLLPNDVQKNNNDLILLIQEIITLEKINDSTISVVNKMPDSGLKIVIPAKGNGEIKRTIKI